MKRAYGIIVILFLVLAGAGLFNLKYMVEHKEKQLKELQAQVLDDQRAIRVLRAEWAYLNSPDNIQTMAVRYLGLKPTSPRQVYNEFEQLPWRLSTDKISSPLVDYIAPSKRNILHDKHVAGNGAQQRQAASLVLFNGSKKPVDAISLLMASDGVSIGGQRP